MTRKHRLFKYYSDQRWAQNFLAGELLFRSLAYFRDFEDQETRGDRTEGTAVFRPLAGLVVNNHTQGKTLTLPGHAFVSRARQEEIFVFCVSRSMSERHRDAFKAVACVEILDVPKFCSRIQAALPAEATFAGRPGHTRIGWRVDYYRQEEGGSPRWALPDLIAISKLHSYAWQDEFRLAFSLTNAFAFENVDLRVEHEVATQVPTPTEHRSVLIKAGSFSDICRLHSL